jgi:aspartyl-tRNA(Asn)/glutamyl-tRNA(Gln) amidotransferase subunit C
MNQREQSSSEQIDVAYVAHLARISLGPDERALYQQQLEHILDHVKTLNELDVSGVEPMAHATPVANQFREDIPHECIDHESVMNNAPEARHDLFFVPKIIE